MVSTGCLIGCAICAYVDPRPGTMAGLVAMAYLAALKLIIDY